MAFLSIRHRPHQREAIRTKVIDRNTGREIPRVIWANTDTGRYRQFMMDAVGQYIVDRVRGEEVLRSRIYKGDIEFRRTD